MVWYGMVWYGMVWYIIVWIFKKSLRFIPFYSIPPFYKCIVPPRVLLMLGALVSQLVEHKAPVSTLSM